jgi:outer membrane protein OmpA-like peptidoglycan-associated protein
LIALAACATLVACSVTPPANPQLTQARARLNTANQDSAVRQVAGDALRQANSAVLIAEKAQMDGERPERVAHLSYMANQYLTLTEATAEARTQQVVSGRAGAERERMRLEQRTQEADTAQRALVQSQAQGQQQQQALVRTDAQLRDVQAELRALNAKPTERGQVVTLGDMLFASGNATLQPAGQRHLGGLAEFLKRNPEQQAEIDGFTDNVGSAASNQVLSERRAASVREALIQMGVSARQLSSRGHGEMAPQASNDDAAGRQINRRVEVLVTASAQGPR